MDFPTLSTGAIACWPLTWAVTYATVVHQFEDDSEQRYRDARPLSELTLVFTDITEADYALVEAFFDSNAGGFDATWSITVSGTLIQNCCFVDDSLERTESKPGYVSAQVRVRQIKP